MKNYFEILHGTFDLWYFFPFIKESNYFLFKRGLRLFKGFIVCAKCSRGYVSSRGYVYSGLQSTMHKKRPKMCNGCRVTATKIHLYHSTKKAKARPHKVLEWQTDSKVQKQCSWFILGPMFILFVKFSMPYVYSMHQVCPGGQSTCVNCEILMLTST